MAVGGLEIPPSPILLCFGSAAPERQLGEEHNDIYSLANMSHRSTCATQYSSLRDV